MTKKSLCTIFVVLNRFINIFCGFSNLKLHVAAFRRLHPARRAPAAKRRSLLHTLRLKRRAKRMQTPKCRSKGRRSNSAQNSSKPSAHTRSTRRFDVSQDRCLQAAFKFSILSGAHKLCLQVAVRSAASQTGESWFANCALVNENLVSRKKKETTRKKSVILGAAANALPSARFRSPFGASRTIFCLFKMLNPRSCAFSGRSALDRGHKPAQHRRQRCARAFLGVRLLCLASARASQRRSISSMCKKK